MDHLASDPPLPPMWGDSRSRLLLMGMPVTPLPVTVARLRPSDSGRPSSGNG